MKVGDTIKCCNEDECIQMMDELQKQGITTDFLYQNDGEMGLWLVVMKVEER